MQWTPSILKRKYDAFLAHHQLPDDVDILYKVLQHPAEKVVREAMGQISSLLIQGRISSTLILSDRLGELDGRITEDATRSYVEGLRAQIQQLEARNK